MRAKRPHVAHALHHVSRVDGQARRFPARDPSGYVPPSPACTGPVWASIPARARAFAVDWAARQGRSAPSAYPTARPDGEPRVSRRYGAGRGGLERRLARRGAHLGWGCESSAVGLVYAEKIWFMSASHSKIPAGAIRRGRARKMNLREKRARRARLRRPRGGDSTAQTDGDDGDGQGTGFWAVRRGPRGEAP